MTDDEPCPCCDDAAPAQITPTVPDQSEFPPGHCEYELEQAQSRAALSASKPSAKRLAFLRKKAARDREELDRKAQVLSGIVGRFSKKERRRFCRALVGKGRVEVVVG